MTVLDSKERTIRNVNLVLNKDKIMLQNEVVNKCKSLIQDSTKRNPLAAPDPIKRSKDKLCELQIQVLERSKQIAELQSKLTELIINCPESAATVAELKHTLESVNFKRSTNSYGYGQDVVTIACNTVDSVKNLVKQLPLETEHDERCPKSAERVYRSLSENSARSNRQNPGQVREATRSRSLSSNHVCNRGIVESSNIKSRDIRALSNLDMEDKGL